MRVGLVGCGNIGNVHAAAIAGTCKAELCAFADLYVERAQEYSKKYTGGKAAAYGSLEEMLDVEMPDVVHICTPHVCHVPMAVKGLKQNIHVFLEKPPAISRDDFTLLKQAAADSSGRVGIAFQNRYNKSTKKVDEILAGGTLGEIRGGRAFVTWSRSAPYYTESSWRGSVKTEGGGVLINQSIHTLDLMLRWMGVPISVEASMQNHHLKGCVDVEDTLEAYLIFSAGCEPVRASFYATTAYVSDEPVLVEIACEHGLVRVEGTRIWYQDKQHKSPVFWQDEETESPGKTYWGNGHDDCINDYYQCLRKGVPYANDLASVENTFNTVMDIYDSARKKRI